MGALKLLDFSEEKGYGYSLEVAYSSTSKDYYPFGSKMPGRSITASTFYRLGYQGQPEDEETGFNNFELRLYDARIGGWLSPDPYNQHFSPYMAMSNNPLSFIDPDGGFDGRYGEGLDKEAYNSMAMWEALWQSCPDCSGSQIAELRFAMGTGREDRVLEAIEWEISYRMGTVETETTIEYIEDREVFKDFFGPGIDGYAQSGETRFVENTRLFRTKNHIKSDPLGDFVGFFFGSYEKHLNGSFGIIGAAADGYRKLPKGYRKKFFKSKPVKKIVKTSFGLKPKEALKATSKFFSKTNKLVSKAGPIGNIMTTGVIVNEVVTNTWDAHTVVNGALLVGAGAATFFAAPAVLVGIAAYGIGDYFFDFSGQIDAVVGRKSGVWGP